MALWTSSDLLRRCKQLARRPLIDQAVTDIMWYDWLTEAQAEVYPEIFSRHPDFAYSAPVLMTTADAGVTYTFGVDAEANAIRPIGHAEIYPTLASIPDYPLYPGIDFIWEATLIRMPANRPRVFQGGPYARFVARPDSPVSAASEPVLQPKTARMLMVYKALEQYAARPGSGAKPEFWVEKYNRSFNKLMLEFATAYNMQGAQAAGASGGGVWYRTGDFR